MRKRFFKIVLPKNKEVIINIDNVTYIEEMKVKNSSRYVIHFVAGKPVKLREQVYKKLAMFLNVQAVN